MPTPLVNRLDKILSITKRIDDLNQGTKTSGVLNEINNSDELYSLKSYNKLINLIDNFNRHTAVIDKLATYNKYNKITEFDKFYDSINSVVNSFNLYPSNKTYWIWLNNINYSNSITQSLAKDWQKVGNDISKSYLIALKEKSPKNDE